MSKRKIEAVVEDPKRRLLDVCRHTAPACWACVAKDMERQRDEAEAEVAKLTAQRTMTVHRLGGEVEGAPTHAGNFLQRIDALRAIEADSCERARALEEAARALVAKLDAIHASDRYMRVWQIAQIHDGVYVGPQYHDELSALRRALSPHGDAT